MREKILKFCLTSALLLGLPLANQAVAGWHTATGSAGITGSIGEARDAAVNDAIRSLLLKKGADVQIHQVYRNGALTRDSYSMRNSVPIRKLIVLEEEKTSNRISVRIKAYLQDQGYDQNKCSTSRIRKNILPLRFRFLDPQAQMGSSGIDQIGKELDRLIYSEIAKNPSLQIKPVSLANLNINGYANSDIHYQRDNMYNLAKQNESQYLIIGNINSVSSSEVGNFITKPFYNDTRTIDFTVTVYDAVSGELVMNENYQGEADWPFKQGEYVNLRSDRFRGSPYGQRVQDLCQRAANDIIQNLQCLKPSARVIEVEGDDFIINIGKSSGLEKDLEFSLQQQYQGYDRQGNTFEKTEDAPGLYRVVNVYANTARLRPVSLQDNILNVQLDDIVTLTDDEEMP
ncbi:MAG TPA: hypothetical protein DCR21_03970 [Succinivibrionaceae bacterium]|nr:flagellar assembly protein T N-terminal domain-containing protein [Succinivibrio sp.]HAR79968.1 hypothetical protein [Succinivibrionaceae bacterium]